jgi:hypothetical protein
MSTKYARIVPPVGLPLEWGMNSKAGNDLVGAIVSRLSYSIRQGRDPVRATQRFVLDLRRLSRNFSYSEAGSREVREAVYEYVEEQVLHGRDVDLYSIWQKYL